MKEYAVHSLARRDLLDIYKHIARDKPKAAVRLIRAFNTKFALLGGQPLMGELMPELAPEVRRFVHGNYVILYRNAKRGIEIARIIHAARDIRSAYFEDQP